MTPAAPCPTPAQRATRIAGHRKGCLCNGCTLQAARYQTQRLLALHRGTWQPLTDAEPTIALVREYLAAGWTERQIEAAAELGRDAVRVLLSRDPSKPAPLQVRAATVTAIRNLATAGRLGPEIPDEMLINVTGSVRRVQALAVGGWSQRILAERYGRIMAHVASSSWVTAANARVIAGAYADLWNMPGPSLSAAQRARKAGWSPAMGWEGLDIDDPRSVPFGHVPVRRTSADLTESSDELLAQGVPMDVIADRLGVRLNTLVKARERTSARERAAALAAVEAP